MAAKQHWSADKSQRLYRCPSIPPPDRRCLPDPTAQGVAAPLALPQHRCGLSHRLSTSAKRSQALQQLVAVIQAMAVARALTWFVGRTVGRREPVPKIGPRLRSEALPAHSVLGHRHQLLRHVVPVQPLLWLDATTRRPAVTATTARFQSSAGWPWRLGLGSSVGWAPKGFNAKARREATKKALWANSVANPAALLSGRMGLCLRLCVKLAILRKRRGGMGLRLGQGAGETGLGARGGCAASRCDPQASSLALHTASKELRPVRLGLRPRAQGATLPSCDASGV